MGVHRLKETYWRIRKWWSNLRMIPNLIRSKITGNGKAYVIGDVVLNVGSGIMLRKGRIVNETTFSKTGKRLHSLLGYIAHTTVEEQQVHVTSIHHGYWNNYYHWNIDSLPRLWGLYQPDIRQLDHIQVLVVGEINTETKQLLEALLPENAQLKISSSNYLIKAKHAIVLPFLAKDSCASLPPEYLQHFLTSACDTFHLKSNNENKHIYISRVKAKTRRFTNEAEVRALLDKRGFTTVVLEDLSLQQQASLFFNAETIIAQHGAGLTNMLYCAKTEVEVIEIFHAKTNTLNHYKCLAQAKNLNYRSIMLDAPRKNDNVHMDLDVLNRVVKSILQY